MSSLLEFRRGFGMVAGGRVYECMRWMRVWHDTSGIAIKASIDISKHVQKIILVTVCETFMMMKTVDTDHIIS